MLDEKFIIDLQEYVDSHRVMVVHETVEYAMYSPNIFCEELQNTELNDFINNKRTPSFNKVLLNFIDKKGVSDTDIYKKAGIDRRHFSKIRSNADYHPGKNTAIALALALELNEKEIDKLLSAAGYSLSNSDTFDLVIQFCVNKKIYTMHNVNEALDYFSLKPLIGVLE